MAEKPTYFRELINKYVERFNEGFPIFEIPPLTDEETIKLLEQCLSENKPCRPETDLTPGVYY